MSEATWDEVEKEKKLIAMLIKRLPEEEQRQAAISICFEAALWAGGSMSDSLGILEAAKFDLIEAERRVEEEEAEEG